MSEPKVSVLLPFHRPGAFFREALTSVISQTGVSFELVLVANHPDHESLQTAIEFANSYPNIRIEHETQQGISHALNRGLLHCNGNYIARMDADDIMMPERLQHQAAFLDQQAATGVVSGLVVPLPGSSDLPQNEGMLAYTHIVNQLITHESMYHHRFIDAPVIHPTVMFRRELIQKYGNYICGEVPEDFELWLRWFEEKVRFAKLNLPVLMWRDHAFRLTRSAPAYASTSFDRVRMQYIARFISHQVGTAKPLWIWGAGKYSRKKIRWLLSENISITGFIDVNPAAQVSGYPVIHYTSLPPPGSIFIVSLVSNRGKYDEIRNFLLEKGYTEEDDFIVGA